MHRRESGGEAAAAGRARGLARRGRAPPLEHVEPVAPRSRRAVATSGAIRRPALPRDLGRRRAAAAARRRGEVRRALYEWTADDQARLERVRADALELGAAVAKRRPRPSPRASA